MNRREWILANQIASPQAKIFQQPASNQVVIVNSFSKVSQKTKQIVKMTSSRIENIVQKLYAKKDIIFFLDESQICTEIKAKKSCKEVQKQKKSLRSSPGSYRAVLNRKTGKEKGCLFWDTKTPGQEKIEGEFQLLVAKNNIKPTFKYSQKCLLCKTDLVWAGKCTKIWRNRKQRLKLDHDMEELGYLISRNINDFSVHQECLDYAYGEDVVQNYEEEAGIEKLDGYPINVIKSIRGRKCCYCRGPGAVTTCAHSSKCKKFYHLHCGIRNGCLQIPSEMRSYCHQHADKHMYKLALPKDVQEVSAKPVLTSQTSKKKPGGKRRIVESDHSPLSSQESSTSIDLQNCSLIRAEDEIEKKGFVEVIEIIDVATLPNPDPHDPDNDKPLDTLQVTNVKSLKMEQIEDFSDEEVDQRGDVKDFGTTFLPESPDTFQVTIQPTTEKCQLCEDEEIAIEEFEDHVVKKHFVLKSYVTKSIIYPVTCTEKNCRRSLDNAKDFTRHLIKDHDKARIHYERYDFQSRLMLL